MPTDLPAAWAAPVPAADHDDPAVRVLDLAARHRAVARAGTGAAAVRSSGPSDPAPGPDRLEPPETAEGLLADLMIRPNPELINVWLARADAGGYGAPAACWTRLARLAAHATAYDRTVLGRVLGARGRWFLTQNPEWRRLAEDCAEVADRPASTPPGPPAPPSPELIRGRPTTIFEHPDPWPDEVVATAFAVVGSATLGRKGRDYASRVGARLPVRHYRMVAAAAEYYLLAPEATPVQRRTIKECFVVLEQAAFTRVQIERAFAPEPTAVELRRIEIPPV